MSFQLMWFHLRDLHIKPDVVMCSALLYGYCRVHLMEEGCMDDACRLVNMMVKQGIIPNDVTYQALTFGYKNNRARNPVETAIFKVQQILQKYGFSTDVDYL